MTEDRENNGPGRKRTKPGTWIALGIGIGVSIGIALNDMGVGVAVAAGLATLLGTWRSRKNG
jgi:hypothetical protein